MAEALNESSFAQEVLQSDKPVLVDFWATWCVPCKMLAPVMEQISQELADKAEVYKVDIDECPNLAAQYNVANIPTVILFKHGKEAARSVGVVPKERILAML